MISKESGNTKKRNYYRMLLVAGAIGLAVGMVFGSMLARAGMAKNIRELSRKIDSLTKAVESFSEEIEDDHDAHDVAEIEKPEHEETGAAEETVVLLPEGILVNDDGVYYWGETEEDLPHGQGIYLAAGYYYAGQFVEGKKDGTFVITPEDDPTRKVTVVYAGDALVTEELTFGQYTVTASSLEVRSNARSDGDIVAQLEEGNVVFRTDAAPVAEGDKEWVEILTGNGVIGWIAADAVAGEEA